METREPAIKARQALFRATTFVVGPRGELHRMLRQTRKVTPPNRQRVCRDDSLEIFAAANAG